MSARMYLDLNDVCFDWILPCLLNTLILKLLPDPELRYILIKDQRFMVFLCHISRMAFDKGLSHKYEVCLRVTSHIRLEC